LTHLNVDLQLWRTCQESAYLPSIMMVLWFAGCSFLSESEIISAQQVTEGW
jgi:hypothetical protein